MEGFPAMTPARSFRMRIARPTLVTRSELFLIFLKAGLALVLAFVGVKMLIADRFPIPDLISLGVVAGLILGAALVSFLFPARGAGD